jgi:hypothetical protein
MAIAIAVALVTRRSLGGEWRSLCNGSEAGSLLSRGPEAKRSHGGGLQSVGWGLEGGRSLSYAGASARCSDPQS